MVVKSGKVSKKKPESSKDNAEDMLMLPASEGNHRIGKLIKSVQKKQKKKLKRTGWSSCSKL